ncbi:MAG: hypothetical protein M1839_004970 [Geoglossum umbratile]|nr:MAG: hypothetical protein M1839_004970 [Geoglossum umbratile]
MTGKRKRARPKHPPNGGPWKKAKTENSSGYHPVGGESKATVSHPLLSLYYPRVVTLRDYFLSKLPSSSRARQRRVASLGIAAGDAAVEASDVVEKESGSGMLALGRLLDSTLVGVPIGARSDSTSHLEELEAFSQSQYHSPSANSVGSGAYSQSEKIIDFVIHFLFNRIYKHVYSPPHIICQGYRRLSGSLPANRGHSASARIPGLVSYFPNVHVDTLKGPLWASLLRLLGKGGECAMIDLVLYCGVFIAVNTGQGNYYQLSGTPLIDLPTGQNLLKPPLPEVSAPAEVPGMPGKVTPKAKPLDPRTPGGITFVRNRMLYARAALNSKGDVRSGLRHIHVLNRYPEPANPRHTVHILKYIFPREFRLHNVFDSIVNRKETVQPFKDYTMREQEIANSERIRPLKNGDSVSTIPKRLRGKVVELVSKLQKLHGQCSYTELLRHYCDLNASPKPSEARCKPQIPSSDESTMLDTQIASSKSGKIVSPQGPVDTDPGENKLGQRKLSFTDFATPPAKVSAFCRAVICKIIPEEFWGTGEVGEWNKRIMLRNVDRFVNLRRYESLALHEVLQGLKITSISWLTPPNVNPLTKVSLSDRNKRFSIFSEFIYYVFDSLLIPLIRSSFHVTETNVHRNRLFFFHHSVWRSLSEPALATLKLSMFEEVKTSTAKGVLERRSLGFSQVRVLPKESGVRPIVNLRRRPMTKHKGKTILGKSINSIMAPVFNVLGYEKKTQPSKLGSALFSVGDMYPKLKSYKAKLEQRGLVDRRLYFAKVDVQSCFDTIPQRRLVQLVDALVTQEEYRIEHHVELKIPDGHGYSSPEVVPKKPSRKFKATARAPNDYSAFGQVVEGDFACGKKNTVFVDRVVRTFQTKETLLNLLGEHVQRNLVKIGKKFYRQKAGIPQGSVLSSLLCNFFYGDLEQKFLYFLDEDSVLLRLIDDFLLITLNPDHARQFLQVMHDGTPEYGVSVNPAKTLVNFEVVVNGEKVPRLVGSTQFPYCATLVDTRTLDICKERRRANDGVIADSLTVEYSKLPGRTFHRKALNAFKIQTHAMFLDTDFNTLPTVLTNIHQNFVESAMKFYSYTKSLPYHKQPRPTMLIKTIEDLVELAFVLLKSKNKNEKYNNYRCAITKSQVKWLASVAFRDVLRRKQSTSPSSDAESCLWLAGLEHAGYEKGIMMLATAPGSPPDLTGSKSSKSSSFHSFSQFDQDGILTDISHFEDIGLGDIDESCYPSPPPNFDRYSASKRPGPRLPISMSTGARHGMPNTNLQRELTNQKRPQYPSLKTHVHSAVENQLSLPNKTRRGLSSPSAPSLGISSMNRLHPRSRTPSPDASSLYSVSPASLSNRDRLHQHVRHSTSPSVGPRRGSWQPSKKTVKELEDEYHDSDEDVPDETVFWNVPVSPCPGRDCALSTGTSMSESSEGRTSSITSGRTPMPLPEAIQNSLPRNRSVSRSPTKSSPLRGTSTSAIPIDNSDPRRVPKTRAKSWNAALEELSEEAKILTEALEAFAIEERRSHEAKVQSGGKNGVVRQPEPRKLVKARTVELPPLRKSNIMIDPLPISKEKEAVLTRTRPSWLPPKSQKEEKRHLKEYQKIMALSVEAERKRQERLRQEKERRDNTKTSILRIWDEHVLPNWDRVLREPRTRELWWRGVAPRSRGTVWQKAVGNDLELTETSYNVALKRAKVLEAQLKKGERHTDDTPSSPPKESKEAEWFRAIRRDVKETYPDLKIFQEGGPLNEGLVDVLMAYAMYRSDVGYVYGTHLMAAHLLLNLSPSSAFLTLANLLNRPLPLAFQTSDPTAISRAYTLVQRALAYKFPCLHTHLTRTLNLPPHTYLDPMFRTLFTLRLPLDIASRLWDVYVFEGDAFLVRTAVGVLGRLEARLYGGKEDVLKLLGWGVGRECWDVGAEDEFLLKVREAGKQEAN